VGVGVGVVGVGVGVGRFCLPLSVIHTVSVTMTPVHYCYCCWQQGAGPAKHFICLLVLISQSSTR
jgi:hypothetical protein